MVDQRRSGNPTRPSHEVQYASGQPGLVQHVGDVPGGEGSQFGGLEQHGVAVDQRRSHFPQRNGNREVPGRDHADDTDGFAAREEHPVGGSRRVHLAVRLGRLTSEIAQNGNAARRFAARFGQRFAFLARHGLGDLFQPGLKQIGCLVQDVAAPDHRRGAPARKGPLRRFYRCVDIFDTRRRKFANHVVGVGRVDVRRPVPADRVTPFAVNQ